MPPPPPAEPLSTRLAQLAAIFLRLGFTAFGGPAAHIAMMEDEIVRRRTWLTPDEFLDLLGATNLIPGPNSTEMAIHVGLRRAGIPGLLVAGACFILPAATIVSAIAWAYVHYGSLPAAAAILYGIKPVIIAIVLQAIWRLGHTAVKSVFLGILALATAAAVVAGANELLVLALGGLLGIAIAEPHERPPAPSGPAAAGLPLPLLASPLAPAAITAATPGLWPIFLIFLKIGSILFGSGYVLLAFLRADLVKHRHWLTETQLLDAVAVGQFTPGPVFTAATFVGYLLAGLPGAAVATIGIFLPAFILVAASGPLIPRLRRSRLAAGFLDGVNAVSLSLMAVAAFQLGRAAIIDIPTALLATLAAAILLRFRINSVWLVLAGALVGLIVWAARSTAP